MSHLVWNLSLGSLLLYGRGYLFVLGDGAEGQAICLGVDLDGALLGDLALDEGFGKLVLDILLKSTL